MSAACGPWIHHPQCWTEGAGLRNPALPQKCAPASTHDSVYLHSGLRSAGPASSPSAGPLRSWPAFRCSLAACGPWPCPSGASLWAGPSAFSTPGTRGLREGSRLGRAGCSGSGTFPATFSASFKSVKVTPCVDLRDCRIRRDRAFHGDSDSSPSTGIW